MFTTVRSSSSRVGPLSAVSRGPDERRLASFLIGSDRLVFNEVYVTAMKPIFAILIISTLMPLRIIGQVVHKPAARHVIICIDGVGISTINKMRAEGHFKIFHPPSRMI